jgi:hypothetical protein
MIFAAAHFSKLALVGTQATETSGAAAAREIGDFAQIARMIE